MFIVGCDFSSSNDTTTICISEILPDGTILILSIDEYKDNIIDLYKDEYHYEPNNRMDN